MDSPPNSCDYLVIGTGLAGLVFALKAAEHGQVILISKTRVNEGNSLMAQGGIAAVVASEDSIDSHISDTLTAGAGLCNEEVVQQVVHQGPERIRDLLKWGVNFDMESAEKFSLHREGGHSHRRILHVEDLTGKAIHSQLLQQVLDHKNIEIHENTMALDLITEFNQNPASMKKNRCYGVYALDTNTLETKSYFARATLLATGGAGKVYRYTSNWSGATGDGIAMAYRAGCRVSNLEFMQFHPTCLYHPHAKNFLISEALRGEGGQLINASGEAFMSKHHPLGNLAPRDIVARSIDAEIKLSGSDCVYLDATHLEENFWQERFPAIYKRCLELGINPVKQPIPVVPAAHYLCGGVLTDTNGCTDLEGLLALGETACTGLHGANRLASNSLLECTVYSHNASEFLKAKNFDLPQKSLEQSLKPWPKKIKQDDDEMIVINHLWDEIRRLMWDYVGIVRTNRRLQRAQNRLRNILQEFNEYYSQFRLHPDIVELRNIALVADLTVQCALNRKESRGIHYNLDFPKSAKPDNSVVHPQAESLNLNLL